MRFVLVILLAVGAMATRPPAPLNNANEKAMRQAVDDVVFQKIASSTSAKPLLNATTIKGYNTTGFLAVVGNPGYGHFQVMYPATVPGSTACRGYIKPSVGAKEHGCLYATNGGPFVMGKGPQDATCLGYAISNGVTGNNAPSTQTSFGITADAEFVFGFIGAANVSNYRFRQLLTGFDWLVREGVSTVMQHGGEVAPRTAIGADRLGRLLIFEVDGIEHSTPPQGLTLFELSQWFREVGAYNAINLDGGGSSVSVQDGEIIDYPTCIDMPGVKCERPVTTWTCVQ